MFSGLEWGLRHYTVKHSVARRVKKYENPVYKAPGVKGKGGCTDEERCTQNLEVMISMGQRLWQCLILRTEGYKYYLYFIQYKGIKITVQTMIL